MNEQYDIVIVGGGVAGLIATLSFGTAGFSVLCVDPTAAITSAEAEGADLRTTAFLQPARRLLERSGVWSRIAPHGAELRHMHIVDAGGAAGTARTIKDFDSADVSNNPFGWNFPNWLLRRELIAALEHTDSVTLRTGVGLADILTRQAEARITLSDATHASARLVIAADGRNSPTRSALGIDVKTTRYGQKALAFAVTHPIPHHNVSTEIHRSGGPFTLVPLPDHEAMPCSGVVWMENGPEVLRLADLNETEFATAMTERSCGLFGPLSAISKRSVWPIITQRATRLTAERVALIAEAAPVVPPIGAPGLNTSLAEIALLLDLAEANPDAIGAPAMLAQYEKTRQADIRTRIAGIDLLNRASRLSAPPLRDLRALGLEAIHSAKPLRMALMRLGLGTGKTD